MSCNSDAIRPRLPDASSSQRAGPSTRARLPRTCTSTSPPPPPQPDSLLDPLDDIPLDSNLDQYTTFSATLPSHSVSSSSSTNHLLKDACFASSEPDLSAGSSSESRPPRPLREPGQMTAQRTRRLRARTAAVIMSLPATFERDEAACLAAEAPPVPQRPKLRRVSGISDLRSAFREADHGPVHFASISSFGASKASYELGFLAGPTQPSSHLPSRSSSRTLVGSLSARPQSAGDQNTLCGSTLSSTSTASRFTTKLYPALSPRRPLHMRSSSGTSQSLFARKHPVHNSLTLTLTPRTQRHTSLQLDAPLSPPPGEALWSCAKISQSATKRAARRGQTPRRVFSNPIAVLASG